ncbi:thiol reductant ABC exporter subunit CydC [Alicyclobacillaceae bacterium I2511]|nr:thiol reductant ABC exporter subunit CydC [Alicyclobacillaceae bacterium I2511]
MSRRNSLSTLQVVWRLFHFIRPYPRQTALAICLSFCTIGANVGLMATSGLLIAKAALHPITILLIWVPIVGVRFFGLSRAAFRYGERYVSHDLTFRLLKEMRVWLYQRIEPLVPLLWQDRRSGDVMNTLVSDIDTLQNFYLRAVAPPVVAVLIAGLAALLFAPFGTTMILIVMVGLALAGVGVPGLTHLLAARSGQGAVQARAQLQTRLVDVVEGMADVLSFGQEEAVLAQVEADQQRLATHQRWLAQVEGLGSGLLLVFNSLTMWGVLWLGVVRVQNGQMDAVYLAMLLQTALAVFEAVMPLPVALQQLGECVEAGRRMFSLTDQAPAVTVPQQPQTPAAADLTVENLSFQYPRTGRWVLRNISFDLTVGRRVAVVGPSGAGKSTLIRLLLRLWDPTEGVVRLGGTDLCQVHPDTVRNFFAVVEQNAHLFHESVADNLRIGHPLASLAQLRQAAGEAQMDSVVAALPEGYDTQVGEFGTRFSGGERQRLALARALLREAPILMLDEPTTGLDPVTELQFMETLLNATGHRSVLLITHRLLHLEQFDEVLVLQAGEVVERGTHAELLRSRGVYRSMWEVEQDRLSTVMSPAVIGVAAGEAACKGQTSLLLRLK